MVQEVLTNHSLYAINKVAKRLVAIEKATVLLSKIFSILSWWGLASGIAVFIARKVSVTTGVDV
jgi:hypothetical protein